MGKLLRLGEVQGIEKKKKIAREILEALPEWFGIEEATENYIEESSKMLYFGLELDRVCIGFLSVKEINKTSAEIYCMGIKKSYHNRGFGKRLVAKAESDLKKKGFKLFSVKTLGEGHPDEGYAKTRKFYESCGFYKLEEFSELWGEECPCLIMVKVL